MKDVDEALGRLIYFCENVYAPGDRAIENDGRRAPFFHPVKELLCSEIKGFIISREISNRGRGDRAMQILSGSIHIFLFKDLTSGTHDL